MAALKEWASELREGDRMGDRLEDVAAAIRWHYENGYSYCQN